MAKNITPPKISTLLVPVKNVMHETESIKVMGLIDKVLKRVAMGLNSNPHLIPPELLILCNTFITQNAKFLQQTPFRKKEDAKKRCNSNEGEDSNRCGSLFLPVCQFCPLSDLPLTKDCCRFVTFGLDLLHTALKWTSCLAWNLSSSSSETLFIQPMHLY